MVKFREERRARPERLEVALLVMAPVGVGCRRKLPVAFPAVEQTNWIAAAEPFAAADLHSNVA